MARRRSRSGGDTGQLGKWAFIIGGLVALIHAFYPVPYATWILVIAGLIIGTVNIKERDDRCRLDLFISISRVLSRYRVLNNLVRSSVMESSSIF